MNRYTDTGTGTSDGVHEEHEHPETIGSFDVLAFLGETPSGPVYRVRRADGKDVFSLKVLSPAALVDNEVAARELPQLPQLRHPAIARVLEVSLEGDPPYVLTEYIPGVTLRDLVSRRRLSFPQAFRIFKQICEALEAAHGKGVLHRSLDPSKVMVTEDLSLVRVIDFGVGSLVGRRVDVSSATTQLMRGMNLVYRAPETLKQGVGKSGSRADVYSAGVIFYEMLTGRRPGGRLSLPSQLNSEVPPDLDPVVLRCLSVNPGERYHDFGKVLSDLRVLEDRLRLGLAHNLQGISRTTSRLLVNKEGERRVPTAVLIAGGLLLVAAAVLVLGLLLPGRQAGSVDTASAESGAGTEQGEASSDELDPPVAADEALADVGPTNAEGDAPDSDGSTAAPQSAEDAERGTSDPQRARAPAAAQRDTSPTPRTPAPSTSSSAPPSATQAASATSAKDEAARESAADLAERVATDLEVARQKFEAGLAEAALDDLDQVIDPLLDQLPDDSPLRLQVALVRADALAATGRLDEAKEVMVEIAVRQPTPNTIGRSQTRLAELTLLGSGEDRYEMASQIFHQLAERLPNTSWAPAALLAAANIERAHGWRVRDPELGEVPAQVRTLRLLAQRYPKSAEAAGSLVRLAEACEELKLFQGAADAYWQLGELTGSSQAWWSAARLLDRRLDQNRRAIEAYQQVSADSEHYSDAQKRIRRLQ